MTQNIVWRAKVFAYILNSLLFPTVKYWEYPFPKSFIKIRFDLSNFKFIQFKHTRKFSNASIKKRKCNSPHKICIPFTCNVWDFRIVSFY